MTILLMTAFVFCFGVSAGIIYCGWWRNRQIKEREAMLTEAEIDAGLVDGETY